MKNVLLVYSSIDGQTKKICETIHNSLLTTFKQKNVSVSVLKLEDLSCEKTNDNSNIIKNCDLLIIGASIRYGKHRKNVNNFIENNKKHLSTIQTAFFSVNLVARKPEKNTTETNPYIQKFLSTTEWQPNLVDVFAGKLDYSLYEPLDKIMIKLIMWITKGPTSSDACVEFTDWQRVSIFIQAIEKKINDI